LRDIRVIPHEAVPVVAEIAILAMDLYSKYGGSRKLHYFDSFHAATSFVVNKPLLTSDKYILEKSIELGIKAIDLRRTMSVISVKPIHK
jgi:hypothetical protein